MYKFDLKVNYLDTYSTNVALVVIKDNFKMTFPIIEAGTIDELIPDLSLAKDFTFKIGNLTIENNSGDITLKYLKDYMENMIVLHHRTYNRRDFNNVLYTMQQELNSEFMVIQKLYHK
jgi:hypothetical protein